MLELAQRTGTSNTRTSVNVHVFSHFIPITVTHKRNLIINGVFSCVYCVIKLPVKKTGATSKI